MYNVCTDRTEYFLLMITWYCCQVVVKLSESEACFTSYLTYNVLYVLQHCATVTNRSNLPYTCLTPHYHIFNCWIRLFMCMEVSLHKNLYTYLGTVHIWTEYIRYKITKYAHKKCYIQNFILNVCISIKVHFIRIVTWHILSHNYFLY